MQTEQQKNGAVTPPPAQAAQPGFVASATATNPEVQSTTGAIVQLDSTNLINKEEFEKYKAEARKVTVSNAEFNRYRMEHADWLRSKGYYGEAARIMGEDYDPTVLERVQAVGARALDGLVTLVVVAVPGAMLVWVGNQFLRLVSKEMRAKLPAWGIHYESDGKRK